MPMLASSRKCSVFFFASLAFFWIGMCLTQTDRPFWLDEIVSIKQASRIGLGAIGKTLSWDTHPPLFYFLLKGWRLITTADAQQRLLTVLFGFGSIVLTSALAVYYLGTSAAAP